MVGKEACHFPEPLTDHIVFVFNGYWLKCEDDKKSKGR